MSTKIKVLILEDVQGQYENIKNELERNLGDQVEVYPDKMNEEWVPENQSFLLDLAKQKKFEQILAYDIYKNIDFFVIDNSLIRIDNTGSEFVSYLNTKKYRDGKYFVIFASGTPFNELQIKEWNDNNQKYIEKTGGEFVLPELVLNEIIKIFNLKQGNYSQFEPIKQNLSRSAKLRENITHADKNFQNIVNASITWTFYFIIVISILMGGFKIVSGFFENNTEQHMPVTARNTIISFKGYTSNTVALLNTGKDNRSVNADTSKQNERNGDNKSQLDERIIEAGETSLLTTAERIYLYLLPTFIILGFFSYYKGNIRATLLGDSQLPKDPEANSTKAISLTKILFISSMISYVLIKVIEELNRLRPNTTKLIASGILILILMGYFLFLERDDHKAKELNEREKGLLERENRADEKEASQPLKPQDKKDNNEVVKA